MPLGAIIFYNLNPIVLLDYLLFFQWVYYFSIGTLKVSGNDLEKSGNLLPIKRSVPHAGIGERSREGKHQ